MASIGIEEKVQARFTYKGRPLGTCGYCGRWVPIHWTVDIPRGVSGLYYRVTYDDVTACTRDHAERWGNGERNV